MIRTLKLLVLALFLAVCMTEAAIEPTLFSPDDNVKILNNDSLEIELFNSSNFNLVQFYNYFCGDCRKYAATFKRFHGNFTTGDVSSPFWPLTVPRR